MKKLFLALLLTIPLLALAKPIGIAAIDENTAIILTDENCPEGSPIKNLAKKLVVNKSKNQLSGCYSLLLLHPSLGYLVILFINEEKRIIFLPLNSFQVIHSTES